MNGITILGTGEYTPETVVTNEMFTKFIDTTDEWITTRTGIRERRMSPDKPNFMMATKAAKAALASAGKTAKDIDCIIVSTCSPDFYYPNTACLVQNLIGAQPCACMDVNTACTGFITAVDIARNFLANDTYKTVLIVASERLTSQIDYTDRASCILFGDGAGAVVIEKGEGKEYYSHSGAEGVQVGTRFLAAEECQIHPTYKQLVVDAKDTDSIVTGRTTGHPCRNVKTKFSKKLASGEMNGTITPDEFEQITLGSLRKAVQDGNLEEGSFLCGAIAGMVKKVQPAKEIVEEMFAEAEKLLNK